MMIYPNERLYYLLCTHQNVYIVHNSRCRWRPRICRHRLTLRSRTSILPLANFPIRPCMCLLRKHNPKTRRMPSKLVRNIARSSGTRCNVYDASLVHWCYPSILTNLDNDGVVVVVTVIVVVRSHGTVAFSASSSLGYNARIIQAY